MFCEDEEGVYNFGNRCIYRLVHKYMCNMKFKYLRQMSTTRAEIFTSDKGLFKAFFHMINIDEHLFLVRKANINNDFFTCYGLKKMLQIDPYVFFINILSPIYKLLHINNKTQS